MTFDDGALFLGTKDAISRALADLGYTEDHEGPLEVEWVRGGASARDLRKTIALAIARRAKARVITVRVIHKESGYDCELEDSGGAWAAETTRTYGADWDQICDGKPYAALGALLEMARADLLGEAALLSLARFRPPPSLGSARLDALAEQARAADRATLTTLAGRACLRVTTDGATVTAFLEPPEVELLRQALGALVS